LYAVTQFARRERAKAQTRLVLSVAQWLNETTQTIFLRLCAKRPARREAFNA
jgi:hypothetical protein